MTSVKKKSSGLTPIMLRSRCIRPSKTADSSTGPAAEASDDGVYRRAAKAASVLNPLSATVENRQDVYTSPINLNWNRPLHFRCSLPVRTRAPPKRSRGPSGDYLLGDTCPVTASEKLSTDYQSLGDSDWTIMKEVGNSDVVLRNGAKKSAGNQSKKSIIMGPPSCDDVLEELDMMETSLRRRSRKTFWQQFRIFCQRSTLHGLSDLCRAETWWLRAFWFVTFVGAFAAAVYGCYHILEQYMESPVVVSYFVQESELKFALPDLVICPFNRFNAEFLKNYSVRTDVAQHMQLVFGMSAKHPAQRRELFRYMSPTSMADLDIAMNETLKRLNMTFDEFLEVASLKCSEFFVDCAFPTGTANCCNNITGVMTFAGKCYRIRGVDQSGPGYGYGMTIVVSLPKALYSLAVNNWLNDGILVKLAEPNQGIDYDMTFIPVGTHALMPLKATRYEFMDDPPRFECLTTASINYSRVDCFDECFVEAAQNACRCAMVGNFNRHKLPLCTTSQFSSCIFSYLTKQFEASQDAEHYFYGCRQRCKPRCTYWQYQSAISYSKFPSEEARAFAQSDEEWTRMKNTIIVDLYYEKLEFTRIKHYRAMTIHGFIANLGGQYSLWLGGSILTLMQLAVFVFNYALGRCRRFFSRRKAKNHPSSYAGVTKKDYQSQCVRSGSDTFWRARSLSAGASSAARRQSTLSNDLHPQLQALTQQNYFSNRNAELEMTERRPTQSNGTCCTDSTGESAGNVNDTALGPLLQRSSLTDIGQANQWRKGDDLDGGCGRRSPSIEVDKGLAVYRPRRYTAAVGGRRSALGDSKQRQWASET